VAEPRRQASQHDLKGRAVFLLSIRTRNGGVWRAPHTIPFAFIEDLHRHAADLVSKHLDKMDDIHARLVQHLEAKDYKTALAIYLAYSKGYPNSVPLELRYLLPTVVM
jgi:hypothetical protein